MPVSEHERYQSLGTISPKWNAAIIIVMNSTCAFQMAVVKIGCVEI